MCLLEKTRKTQPRKKTVKVSKCVECGRLEGRPGSSQGMDSQQMSMAPMRQMEGEEISAQGMDSQQRSMAPMRQLDGKLVSAQGMEAQQRSMAPVSLYKDKATQKVAATGLEGRQDFINGGAGPDLRLVGGKKSSPWMEEQSKIVGNESNCSSCKSEEQKLDAVLQTQARKLEDEINDIKKTGAGRMVRVFKLKQKLVENRKVGQEPTAIKDPETEDLLVASSDIRRTSLNYCVNNLKNREVVDNVKVIVALKENLHNMRMKEDTKDEFEVELDEYEAVVDKFKRKDTKSYDFLVKAGTN